MTTTSETAKEQINKTIGNISDRLPNYRKRPSQYTMIARAATLFGRARTELPDGGQHAHIIEVDAPTGTGKSQGYLIPGIIMARRLKKRLVVSSATVGLQEQLCEFDLPLLNQCIEGGVTYSIAKGRTRYVCPYRLEHEAGAAGQASLLDDAPKLDEGKAKERDAVIIRLHESFTNKNWNGDRDSLGTEIVEDDVWRTISTDRHGCQGSNCPKVNACPFYKARLAMENVDVIVTNHDLLLADLSLGGGKILTEPEDTIYCVDEAHHLPEKAVQTFSAHHSVRSALIVAERMVDLFGRNFPVNLDESDRQAIIKHSEALHSSLTELRDSLDGFKALKNTDQVLRFPFGEVPEAFYSYGTNIAASSSFVFGALAKTTDALMEAKEEGRGSPANIDRAITDVAQLTVRLEMIYKVWTLMLSDTPAKAPPIAKWVKPLANGDFVVSASPISAAGSLKNLFYDRAHAILMTSATMTTLGKFDLYNHKSGLFFIKDKVESLQIPSPFDFAKQARLIIPHMRSDPKNVAEHTLEVIQLIPAYVKLNVAEGNLVLFASRKQMEDVANGLMPGFRQHVMLQGECTKDELLRRHREKIDNGKVSVIFGLAGMSEGVDLPGKYCTRVIIAKIPFAVPTDPIEAAEAEWLQEIGRNAFTEVTVPAAGMKLAQSTGRLIRTEDDYGEVIVLDTRLATTNYGKMLLKGLPAFHLQIDKEAA
jgi:ATP-dependent DNA helicase DinG